MKNKRMVFLVVIIFIIFISVSTGFFIKSKNTKMELSENNEEEKVNTEVQDETIEQKDTTELDDAIKEKEAEKIENEENKNPKQEIVKLPENNKNSEFKKQNQNKVENNGKKDKPKVQNTSRPVINEKAKNESISKPEIKENPKKEEIMEVKKQETNINKPIEKPKEDINKNNCAKGKHMIGAGNSKKWFNTKEEAIAEYRKIINLWGKKWENFEIDDATYEKNCPYRLRSMELSNLWEMDNKLLLQLNKIY